MSRDKVAIIGSGMIGKSWAMIFAAGGYEVSMYDSDPGQLSKVLPDVAKMLEGYEKEGVLKGSTTSKEQLELIGVTSDLSECLKDVVYVQECVPEILDLKVKVWLEIDSKLPKSPSKARVLASSSSAIVPSKMSEGMSRRDLFLVAHPVNPPYLTPMVEVVPAPWTGEEARSAAREMMTSVGQVPVSLSREVPGFALNRLQYAVLNESVNLVADGLLTAEDLDVVVRHGLGLRYAFMGPFEVMHTNANGTQDYIDRYGNGIYNVSQTIRAAPKSWTQATDDNKKEITSLAEQMNKLYPLDKLDERRQRRDRALMELAKLKKNHNLL